MDSEELSLTPDDNTKPGSLTGLDINTNSGSTSYIIYITLAVVFGLIILWILLVVFTQQPPLAILQRMTDVSLQLSAASK